MSRYSKHTSKILFRILCALFLLLIGDALHQSQKAKQTIAEKVPAILGETIKTFVTQKSQGFFFYANYAYDPTEQKMGEYEERVATYADTTFTYQCKLTDPATSSFNALQTGFVDGHILNANDLHHIFDSLLHVNNIHAQSIIGTTASFYTKMDDWSNDTTALNINYRTTCTNQGVYEDINYYAYLAYSPLTLWKLMPKRTIYILFTSFLLTGIFLCGHTYQKRKRKRSGITALADGNYQIGDILFDVREKRLVAEKHDMKLGVQLHELLLMFVQADRQRVNKEEIKQRFWPKNSDPINNMTSAIGRIKVALKEVDSVYTIVSDPKNDDFYLFLPHFSS